MSTPFVEEICGEAAVLAPDDAAAFGEALRSILDDTGLAAQLREAGPKRAATFNWPAVASALVRAYDDAASFQCVDRCGTVDIVIPAFDPGPFLRRAIDSVVAQTHEDWRAVVVDDGSREDLSWVADLDPRVRMLRQSNQGLSAARNRGIAELSSSTSRFSTTTICGGRGSLRPSSTRCATTTRSG